MHCILVRNLLSNLFQAAIDKGDSETMAALMAGQYVDTALDENLTTPLISAAGLNSLQVEHAQNCGLPR